MIYEICNKTKRIEIDDELVQAYEDEFVLLMKALLMEQQLYARSPWKGIQV